MSDSLITLPYDIYGRSKGLTAFVLNPVRKPLCQIHGITAFDVSIKFNDISEIQFEVQRFTINKSTMNLQETEAYQYLHSFCQIYIPELGEKGYFLIHSEPTIIQESTRKEAKTFTARSYESILEHESLVNFVVNCGTDESIEMTVKDNLDDIGAPIKKIRLYDSRDKKFSLLDYVLKDDYYGWKVGHVDTTIAGQERSFEVSNQTLYSFLHADVSKAFRCVFDFNVKDKEINVYDIETVGKDTNIYLSIDHFLQQVQIAPKNEFCYTVFNVSGEGDLGIDLVNFGSNKIVNIDYPLSLVSEELLERYKSFEGIRDSLRTRYFEKQKEYANILNKEAATLDRQPSDTINNNWRSTVDYDLQGLKDMLQSMKDACKAIRLLYTDEDGKLDVNALEESDDAAIYYSYHDICIPDLKNEIKAREEGEGEDYEAVDPRFVWGTQGLHDLEDTKLYLEEQISNYVKQGYDKPWSKSSGISKETFNDHKEELKKCRERLTECKAYLSKRQAKYKELQQLENQSLADLKDIASHSSLEFYINYGDINSETAHFLPINDEQNELPLTIENDSYAYISFTEEEVAQIKELYRESDYQNTNFLVTEYDDLVSTSVVANDLYDDAKKELFIESQPQYTWSVVSNDLLAMKEFDNLRGQVRMGDYVWLGRYSKATPHWTMAKQKFRVIEIDFNGLKGEPTFNMVFSTMETTKDGRNDFAEMLDNAVTSSVNSIARGLSNSVATTAKTVTSSLIKPYIEALRAKIDTLEAQKITVQDLTAVNALIENLTVYDLKAGNIESDGSIVLSNRQDYGSIILENSQMIFKDQYGDTRVIIGKSDLGDYVVNIYGPRENGVQKLLWGSSGITRSAVGDELIENRMLGTQIVETGNIQWVGISESVDLDGKPVFAAEKIELAGARLDEQWDDLREELSSIEITCDTQMFIDDDGAVCPETLTLTTTMRVINDMNNLVWSYRAANSNTWVTVPTVQSSTMPYVNQDNNVIVPSGCTLFDATNNSIVFKAAYVVDNLEKYRDIMSVFYLSNSEGGGSGEPAYTVILSNEAQTIATTDIFEPIESGTYECGVKVFRGATRLTPTSSSNVTDGYFKVTASITASGVTVTTSANTDTVYMAVSPNNVIPPNFSVDLTITVGGLSTTLSKVISFSASAAGTSPILVRIDSTMGTVFRNKTGYTVLTCTVIQGGQDITSSASSFTWYRYDANGDVDTSWTRTYLGNTISISADDVNRRNVFGCEVNFD